VEYINEPLTERRETRKRARQSVGKRIDLRDDRGSIVPGKAGADRNGRSQHRLWRYVQHLNNGIVVGVEQSGECDV
jgi:hypothetical protein